MVSCRSGRATGQGVPDLMFGNDGTYDETGQTSNVQLDVFWKSEKWLGTPSKPSFETWTNREVEVIWLTCDLQTVKPQKHITNLLPLCYIYIYIHQFFKTTGQTMFPMRGTHLFKPPHLPLQLFSSSVRCIKHTCNCYDCFQIPCFWYRMFRSQFRADLRIIIFDVWGFHIPSGSMKLQTWHVFAVQTYDTPTFEPKTNWSVHWVEKIQQRLLNIHGLIYSKFWNLWFGT